jgi:hypothetical protein
MSGPPKIDANETKTKKKFVIVPQTKIAFIGYILLLVAMIAFIIQQPLTLMYYVADLVGFVVITILGLYVINCTVLGHCNIYAWIMGYVIVIVGVLAVMGLVRRLI